MESILDMIQTSLIGANTTHGISWPALGAVAVVVEVWVKQTYIQNYPHTRESAREVRSTRRTHVAECSPVLAGSLIELFPKSTRVYSSLE